MIVKRGDIFYADLSPVVGSEQGGLRPVLIVQNDVGNKYSPTVIAAAITSKTGKTKLPTHIDVSGDPDQTPGLARDSVILLEQVRTIDKRRLRERIGRLDLYTMQKVNSAISVSFGLSDEPSAVAVASAPRDVFVASVEVSSTAVAGDGTGAMGSPQRTDGALVSALPSTIAGEPLPSGSHTEAVIG